MEARDDGGLRTLGKKCLGASRDIYAKSTHPEMESERARLPPAVKSVDQGTVCPNGKHVEHSAEGEGKGASVCQREMEGEKNIVSRRAF